MMLALVENLSTRIPGARFTVLSRHPEEIIARYGIAAIQNLDHPRSAQPRGYWFYGFNDRQPREHIDRIRGTIASADLLIIGGGNLLLDVTDDWLRGPIAWHWFSSEIARIYQVPYMLFANTVGPFRTEWGKMRSAHILRHAAAVTVREEESLTLLRAMDISPERVRLLPDPALAVRPNVCAGQEILSEIDNPCFPGRLKIGISVRDLSWQLNASQMRRYLTTFQNLCDRLIEEFDADIVLVPQCSYEYGSPAEDDRTIAAQLLEGMRNRDRTHVLEKQYRAEAIMGVYHLLDLVLTTRLHGAVFSAAARKPFVAVSYLPKVKGFLRHLGMEEWSLALDDFQDEATAFRKIADLIARREEVIERLTETVSCAERQAQEHFDIIERLMRYPEAAERW
jgi:colanic acid/amylovoran biosynthesis protein